MRLGLIARADRTGLAAQTLDFYRHMEPDKVLIVDLEHLNGFKSDRSLFDNAPMIRYTPYPEPTQGDPRNRWSFDNFLEDLDIVFTCETPYDYYLFTKAAEMGVKTVLQYNYEFLDHIADPTLPRPDLFVAPSLWNYDKVPFDNKVFIPVPVDRERFPYEHRESVEKFLHVSGNPAAMDRNGTHTTIEAFRRLGRNDDLILYCQYQLNAPGFKVRPSVEDNARLYDEGDVFVFPRKFGGLCLPMQEALSRGMPVITTDLEPQSEFLPDECLVPTIEEGAIQAKASIPARGAKVTELMETIRQFSWDEDLVPRLSRHADTVAERISWTNMTDVYLEAFERLRNGLSPSQRFSWHE